MSQYITEHSQQIANIAKNISYSTSAGMMASSAADFMNDNVGVVGGLLGLATLAVNTYYRRKEYKIKEASR
jgi:hypothetical protein